MFEAALPALEQQRLERRGLDVALGARENAAEGKAPLALTVVLQVRAIDARELERRRSLVDLARHILIRERLARSAGRGVRGLFEALRPAQNAPDGCTRSGTARDLACTVAFVPGAADTLISPLTLAVALASAVSAAARACGETICGALRFSASFRACSFMAAS